jgi:hypothetical protein
LRVGELTLVLVDLDDPLDGKDPVSLRAVCESRIAEMATQSGEARQVGKQVVTSLTRDEPRCPLGYRVARGMPSKRKSLPERLVGQG